MTIREAVYRSLRTGDFVPLQAPRENLPVEDDAPAQRLAAALRGALPPPADLVPLVRHLVRSETEPGRVIKVAAGADFPQRPDWEQHGFWVISSTSQGYQLQALGWQPQWLPGAAETPPDAAPFAAYQRNMTESVPGDPFLRVMGFQRYRSVGQQWAIRAVLGAPPGSSLIINLPTGAGKSLCSSTLGKLPFLDGSGSRGVVVVVVPTTALAIDQARAFGGASSVAEFAYTGGSQGNQAIRRRIVAGEQPIVFTSPESLTASLRPALYRASEDGLMKAMVVDEAHMVDLWGDEFRPAFQEIAGLRRALLRVSDQSRFRTYLLSATLTEASVGTLQKLFGDPEPCRMSAAVQLRPEPAYWVRRFETDADRQDAVLDALRHLPRPSILYVTEREEAYEWEGRLREKGHRRVDCMTGDTSTRKREEIIQRWITNQTDIIVATAAFGLGMDKGDVRTVIHACLPETLDRFYQEVGRGGRDGRACISLLLYTPGDEQTAITLASKRLLTTEVGLRRWRAMFSAKETLPDGRIRVDLRTPPGTSVEHIDMRGARSVEWNARTLTLLQRSGLIELDDSIPDGQSPDLRTLSVRDEEHLTEEAWQAVVETYRQAALTNAGNQRRGIMTLVRGRRCASATIADLYRLPGVEVARACGGCPACRSQGKEPFEETPEPSRWPWPATQPSDTLVEYAQGRGGFVVYYSKAIRQDRLLRSLRRFTEWAVQQGVTQFVLSQDWPDASSLIPTAAPIVVESRFRPREMPALPTLLLHSPTAPEAERAFRPIRYRLEAGTNSSLCLLVMPDDAADPAAPDRLLRDMLRCPQYSLETLLEREHVL